MTTLDQGRRFLEQGNAALRRGDPVAANQAFKQAAETFADASNILGAAHAWRGLTHSSLLSGKTDDAETLQRAAIQAYELVLILDPDGELGEVAEEGLAMISVMRAGHALRTGDHAATEKNLNEAYPRYRAREGMRGEADLWAVTARLAALRGNESSSVLAWKRALKSTEGSGTDLEQAIMLLQLGEAEAHRGKLSEAEVAMERAERIGREMEDLKIQGQARVGMARLARRRQENLAAMELFKDALDLAIRADERRLADQVRIAMLDTAMETEPNQVPIQLGALLENWHQITVDLRTSLLLSLAHVALRARRAEIALLAAVAAERLAPGWKGRAWGIQARALRAIGAARGALLLAERRYRQFPRNASAQYLRDAYQRVYPGAPVSNLQDTALQAQAEHALEHAVLRVAPGLGLDESIDIRRLVEAAQGQLRPHGAASAVAAKKRDLPMQPVLVWSNQVGEQVRQLLPLGVSTIGRSGDADIQLQWDSTVSRVQAVIERTPHGQTVRDLGSSHGTWVNGKKTDGATSFGPSDTLQFGSTAMDVVAVPILTHERISHRQPVVSTGTTPPPVERVKAPTARVKPG